MTDVALAPPDSPIDVVPIDSSAPRPPTPRVRSRWLRMALHAIVWLLTLTVVALAVWGGLRVRRWTWELAEPAHFLGDIRNGYSWGIMATGPEGYLNQYEKLAHEIDADTPQERRQWNLFLDYAPLRLGVMTMWARHVREAGLPNPTVWRHDYKFHWPPLWFNAGMELLGATAAFFLVRRWLIVSDRGSPAQSWPREWMDRLRRRPPPPALPFAPHAAFRGWWQGLVAALLLWFSPLCIVSAHAWPTWDTWVASMYLLALLAASYGRWFWCGVVVGTGAMLKGQQLFGAPVFLAWTLLNGDWRNALRWLSGLGVALAVIASPWLTTVVPAEKLAELYADQAKVLASGRGTRSFAPFIADRVWNGRAIAWAVGVLGVAIALPFFTRSRSRRTQYIIWPIVTALVLWPLAVRHDRAAIELLLPALAAIALTAFFARRWTDRVLVPAASLAGALLGGMVLFGSSRAWWDCGILYGTEHYAFLTTGYASNLAALLHERFGWQQVTDVMFTWQWPQTLGLTAEPLAVTVHLLTRTLFVLSLVPCLWAVARQARRGGPRLLVAAVAPWVMFFCIPTQIHERYLIYAASVAVIMIGQSVGMTLLGLFLMAASWVMTVFTMLNQFGAAYQFGIALNERAPTWFSKVSGNIFRQNLAATYPDIAWGVLLASAVILYVAVTTTKGRGRRGTGVSPVSDGDEHGREARAT